MFARVLQHGSHMNIQQYRPHGGGQARGASSRERFFLIPLFLLCFFFLLVLFDDFLAIAKYSFHSCVLESLSPNFLVLSAKASSK